MTGKTTLKDMLTDGWQETVDEKTREDLSDISRKMYSEGLTAEAISEARKSAGKLLVDHPGILEQAVNMLFNDSALGKMRESYEKNAAEGKPSLSPYPFGKTSETKDEGLVESLD
jgi:hypothetical protein